MVEGSVSGLGRRTASGTGSVGGSHRAAPPRWYALAPEEVASALGVSLGSGLSEKTAAGLLSVNGPNALPEEKPVPGWLRFVREYRSYMQIILSVAAVVSLAIQEWTTAAVLVGLT